VEEGRKWTPRLVPLALPVVPMHVINVLRSVPGGSVDLARLLKLTGLRKGELVPMLVFLEAEGLVCVDGDLVGLEP
jgi:DNA-binding IclR family transcriptional regulator